MDFGQLVYRIVAILYDVFCCIGFNRLYGDKMSAYVALDVATKRTLHSFWATLTLILVSLRDTAGHVPLFVEMSQFISFTDKMTHTFWTLAKTCTNNSLMGQEQKGYPAHYTEYVHFACHI